MGSGTASETSRTLAVGNGAGFWGDNLDAPYLLARDGAIDVLTLEYLAELTMAILSHLRAKDKRAGFVADFPELVQRLIPILQEKEKLGVVTNAGGLNPPSCAARCGEVLTSGGLGGTSIGVITGDDVLDRIPDWLKEGIDLSHLETGEPLGTVLDRLVAANVYLGARPIAECVEAGSRFVIAGRVADASLTVGPAAARFGWSWEDWDRLAGATVAGHLIECGAQVTGGLWHGWDKIPDLAGVGYPIAEISADGSFVITKPDGTGGQVTVETVTEQLLYEIDDPSRYRTPDVDADFTRLSLNQAGADRVAVTGSSGRPRSDQLKIVAVYRDGWTASGILAVVGRDAAAKARAAGAIVLKRVRRAGFALADSLVECLGAGDVAPGVLRPEAPPFEVVLRVTVRDPSRAAVERFCRELAPLVTAGPPGIVGYASGRPSPRPAFGYWPALLPRVLAESRVRAQVRTAQDWAGSAESPPGPG
ncbi:MAG TPA: acyclic terpene utilization AtuA family protein [Isosphaeraceae bacterium]|nr:acyclic terpene utilization AtuA family protein [Isosphaeraceae bacterium]